MERFAAFELQEDGGKGATLALSGPWLVSTIGACEAELETSADSIARVDLSKVTEIDTAGAWLANRVAERSGAEITGAGKRAQRLIDAAFDL